MSVKMASVRNIKNSKIQHFENVINNFVSTI